MKYAIVSGCASGIGLDVAKILVNNGVTVFGLDINHCKLALHSYICDVSDERQVTSIMEDIVQKTKRIDYLINCAGMLTIGKPLYIKDLPIKQWDALLRINLRSVMVTTKIFYPLLKDAVDARIINLSSEQSFSPDVGFTPYAVSKSGINCFTQCCAKEFSDYGIRVNAVAFGTVKTGILSSFCNEDEEEKLFKQKDNSIPFGVIPSEVAAQFIVNLLGDEYRFMTGEIIRMDGGNHL